MGGVGGGGVGLFCQEHSAQSRLDVHVVAQVLGYLRSEALFPCVGTSFAHDREPGTDASPRSGFPGQACGNWRGNLSPRAAFSMRLS